MGLSLHPIVISDKVLDLCKGQSVTQLLEQGHFKSPADASKKLFGHLGLHSDMAASTPLIQEEPPSQAELEKAAACGNWGSTKPSELFLRMFHAALLPLASDPLSGIVSPSLIGSHGIIPLTVIGTVADICRHMSNLIARAEHEVILVTNYWMASSAVQLLVHGLRELNRRAKERDRKVIVKIIYDRGSVKQLFDSHVPVSEKEFTNDNIKLPHPDEIPFVSLEVRNCHAVVIGTYHSKFLVADRKYGLVCSNNLQDNDNLEMMSHIEGPVVESLYDSALLIWHNEFEPPLPCIQKPPPPWNPSNSDFQDPDYLQVLEANGDFKMPSLPETWSTASHDPQNPHFDDSNAAEIYRNNSAFWIKASDPVEATILRSQKVCTHLNLALKLDSIKPTATEPEPISDSFTPFIPHLPHDPVPIALVNRKPIGNMSNNFTHMPQNAAWSAALRYAKSHVFIQSPNVNAKPLIPEILAAVRRGVTCEIWCSLGYNDLGEMLPNQGGTNETVIGHMRRELKTDSEEVQNRLKTAWYVGKDQNIVIHNKQRGRNCHIKLLIADNQVAIQGSGNQDTQSWCHSLETNIMIDSSDICESWMRAIRRNQNTHLYGMGLRENDGQWLDRDGHTAPLSLGKNPERSSWAGIVGAVQRVRGKGGF